MPTDFHTYLTDRGIPCEADAPLGPRTWYRVGGRADLLARPTCPDQLAQLMAGAHQRGVPVHVLGSGANLLVLDAGVRGVVVRLDHPRFATYQRDGKDKGRLTVGAGHDLFKLVTAAARDGLGGLERVAGIPASLGGAIRMNAGGAFGDIGSCVEQVTVMDHAGQVHQIDRDSLVFAYRRAHIDAPVILSARLALTPADPAALARRVKEVFFYKKTSQPMGARSAGCAFKNPAPEGPAAGRTAGQLIDQAGLKGHAIGGAMVSMLHANFIVADKAAPVTADAIYAVLQHAQKVVADRLGVPLQREVVVWGP